MKSTILVYLFISLFLGIILFAVGAGAIFPSVIRVSAPVVCNGEMEIKTRSYSYKPGSVSVEHKYYCLDKVTGEKRDITFFAVMVAGVIYGLIIFVLLCANLLVRRLSGKQPDVLEETPPAPAAQTFSVPAPKIQVEMDDPAELLRKLKELRQADLITEQDYEAKKAEILNKM